MVRHISLGHNNGGRNSLGIHTVVCLLEVVQVCFMATLGNNITMVKLLLAFYVQRVNSDVPKIVNNGAQRHPGLAIRLYIIIHLCSRVLRSKITKARAMRNPFL